MKDSQDYVTAEQARALIECADRPRDKLLIKFLFHTSRRINEVVKPLGPTPSDINYGDRLIRFNILKKRRPFVSFIHVDVALLDSLKSYIDTYNIRPSDFIFPFSDERSRQIINKAALKAAALYPNLFTIDLTPRGVTRVRIGRGFIKNHTFRHAALIHVIRSLEAQGKQTEGLLTANQLAEHGDWEQTLEYLRRFGQTAFKRNINDVFLQDPV